LAEWLDRLLFRAALFGNRNKNNRYRQQDPQALLPGDYFLYETYQLDYQKFIEDGALAAREIIEWTKPWVSVPDPRILDWGCGVARIVRHLPALLPGAALYGCDINEKMIEWDKANHPGIAFTAINNFTPIPYAESFFDLVYGLSIFTHINASKQADWIAELSRIIKPGGLLLITTQGSYYEKKLLQREKNILKETGVYTQDYSKQGHRMMSTYNKAEHFKTLFAADFSLLEFHAGETDRGKTGGQDLWIWGKK
jgi:SAM-dependent methyltransferase